MNLSYAHSVHNFLDVSFMKKKIILFHFLQPPVMHLAAVNLKMSLTEAFAASTINAAHSIGRSKTHGSIEVGKVADLLVLDAPR